MSGRVPIGPGVVLVAAVLAGGCLGVSPASVDPSVGSGSPPGDATGPCPVVERSGVLASDRLANLEIGTAPGVDRVEFRFDTGSDTTPRGQGTLRAVAPPFVQGGSGEPVHVDGQRFVEVRFEGVVIADESGNAVYQGPREARPALSQFAAIRHVVVIEQFEGVTTFVIGFDGPGCVGLSRDPEGATVIIEVAHR